MRVLVLGAAISGVAAARLARNLGWSVVVYDQRSEPLPALTAQGIPAVSGEWDSKYLEDVDLVVTSPGVPESSRPISEAIRAMIPVWSEIELAWRQLSVPVVAITGTNGKTTVTSLIAEMLAESGRRAAPLGNIGTPLSDAVGRSLDVAVVEVSSFQLRFTESFRPDVAVVTNVAPDHLDWHGTFDRYVEAKRHIVARQRREDVVVFDVDDRGATGLVAGAAAHKIEVSGRHLPTSGYGVDEGRLVLGATSVDTADLAVTGPAFLFDLAAAAAAASQMGATSKAISSVARNYVPAPHRRTTIMVRGGVTYVDDSKATNPHAALASISSFESVVLIAGGLAKGLDVAPLAAHPNVHTVVAIGESAPVLLEAAGVRGVPAESMKDAVATATRRAKPGDVVLLAPGCASFDMFADYGRRGDAFAEALRALPEVSPQ